MGFRFDLLSLVGLFLLPFAVSAQEVASAPQALPDVVVTATRTEQSPFDLPASIDAIDMDAWAQSPQIKTSEFLMHAPGVLGRDRQNYAQDEQISIRGFGARSTFGVRGVRLYTDGIPATMPDGQGQTSHFNLGSGERIEVLRGPYSALYGNSSGGVIQLITAEPATTPQEEVDLGGGSFGARAAKASASGTAGGVGYAVQGDWFATDGWRDHSEAQRLLGNGKLKFKLGGGTLTVLGNVLSIPEAKDPLGLNAAELAASPKQVTTGAITFNTRKSVGQYQGGAVYELLVNASSTLHLMAYGGHRDVTQYLSVPVAAQGSPTHSGGVVDLGSDYGGTDARWTWRALALSRPFELTGGFSWDRQNQARRGYENFIGAQTGVQGNLRRDESDDVYNADEYLQAQWKLATQWTLSGGLRHSELRFFSNDHYMATGNGNDGGSKNFAATTPVAGLVFAPTEAWRVYASYGRGFETPTFNELAYSPGGAGLNFALDAATSSHYELGAKHRFEGGGSAELAAFDSETRHEIILGSNTGGRGIYGNATGLTRRRGIELGWNQPIAPQWIGSLTLTRMDTQFNGSGAPIPGVPNAYGTADLRWNNTAGWKAGMNLRAVARTTVDDKAAQMPAPGYALLGADLSWAQPQGHLSAYLQLQNLLDRSTVGSVIVNEANNRYYEPGLPRSAFAGLGWKF